MWNTPYLYLYINIFTISFPLIRSFELRIAYYRSFKELFLGIGITAVFFLIWDIIFTHLGIWGFNPRYLSGIGFFGLPLGEYLFFITVPFASVFIYRVMNFFIKEDLLSKRVKNVSNFLIFFCIALAIAHYGKWYSLTTFSFLSVALYLHFKVWKTPWLSRFYLAYGVVLIPFLLVNGILTGSFIEEQVVWYNDVENMGIRVWTIPFEDAFYGMLLILMVISFYEYFYKKRTGHYTYETSTEKSSPER